MDQVQIQRVDLTRAGKELDTVVVIDVIRAFTTTAFAFDANAKEIILVSEVDEALALKSVYPRALLMGESKGSPIAGFDLGNSPSALVGKDLSGRVLIHRTSAGTQGAAASAAARDIYVTGLCNARATAMRLLEDSPESITLVETGSLGDGWGEEDVACGDYIHGLLINEPMDPDQIVERVSATKSAMLFSGEQPATFPSDDADLFLDIDKFQFVMKVKKADGLLVLQKA
ncbi:MAG: 2-phosphosulfolactate phosphatase [Anaerolineales bacterium]|jgi:2-phosphosulfolactate phosphatase